MPLEPLPVNRAPELVFGLVAPIGVDLGDRIRRAERHLARNALHRACPASNKIDA